MAAKKPFSLRRVTRKTASYFMVIPCKRNQKGQYRLKIKMTAKGPECVKTRIKANMFFIKPFSEF